MIGIRKKFREKRIRGRKAGSGHVYLKNFNMRHSAKLGDELEKFQLFLCGILDMVAMLISAVRLGVVICRYNLFLRIILSLVEGF